MEIHVVGGGVVGLFTAYVLAGEGYEVTLYEKCEELGCGASGHNAGVLHRIQTPFNSLKTRLMRIGHHIYREEIDWIEPRWTRLLIPYRGVIGGLGARALAWILRRNGIDAEIISQPHSVEPSLNPVFEKAIMVEGYGVVEPRELLGRLAREARERGALIRMGEEHPVCGEAIHIIAAGPESYRIGRLIGDDPPRHRLSLGVMLRIDLETENIIAPLPSPGRKYTKGGAIIPHRGYSIIGPGFAWLDEDPEPEAEARRIYHRFQPLLRERPEPICIDEGVRPINMPRDDYVIRRVGRNIILYGIDSPGLTAAPAIAKLISIVISRDTSTELGVELLERMYSR